MRSRPSARLLVIDEQDRALLFRFEYETGALAGQSFWATPGGGLEPGESFEDAARRELAEETGLVVGHPGRQVARREFVLLMPDGERVMADERFFLIRVLDLGLSDAGWTDLEREVMTGHRWWRREELLQTEQQVWPENLPDLLDSLAAGRG